MFWIALAAQITGPLPEAPGRWFSVDDVPQYLLREGPGLWHVPIRLNVATDGTVRRCDVEKSSGIADLNRLTCRIVLRRAKFQAAQIDGVPSPGVFRTLIMWAVADAPWDTSKVSSADVDVTVKGLPAGLKSPILVRVIFTVDAAGTKSRCAAEEAKGRERVENHPALVPIACEQINKLYQATPATDETGKPIVSVQNALVRFSAPESN